MEIKYYPEGGSITLEQEQEGAHQKKLPLYAVVLHNDDYTTMDFVIKVLECLFHKTPKQAAQIMLKVHYEGRGVAGIYCYDIAEVKMVQVHQWARTHKFPLKCTLELVEWGEIK